MTTDLTKPRQAAQAARTERGRETQRVAVVSAVVNIVLAAFQILVGLLAQSAALVADGVHSISDLLSDVLVWAASRHAAQAPDADHPYGHGRFETAATLGLGTLLVIVALGIIWNGFERLLDTARPTPSIIALVVAALGIAAKESLYHYTMRVARRLSSEMLRANAWHHRSDAISSVIVLIGVGAAVSGYPAMDAVAAILVGLMVARIGWDLGFTSLTELVDTALDKGQVAEAKRVIMGIDGVRSVHMLRTRRHGAEASADVHVQVPPRITVSEGHMISQAVEDELLERVAVITDVTVHIDPENDEDQLPCRGLPLREEALRALEQAWEEKHIIPAQREYRLHYLDGRVDVELVLPLAGYTDEPSTEEMRARLEAAVMDLPWLGVLRILYG